MLGKHVVLLPNNGSSAWLGYPGLSVNLTVSSVLNALQKVIDNPTMVDQFLDDVVGGRKFDNTERAYRALYSLFELHLSVN